jgi:lipopolysaccharide/colanic/teichoic acid biosynthesis glycosyltransferase
MVATMQLAEDTFSTAALPSDRAAKRAFDILVAIAGLFFFSPLLLLVAIAVKLETRGPLFSSQVARGFNNELIRPLRFRTTYGRAGGTQVKAAHSHLTRVGSALRSSGIEGLPQLINILRGEMSLVGPQLRTAFAPQLVHERPPQVSRRMVRPGIIGWAQVNGCSSAGICSAKEIQQQIEHDLYYIDNWSFLLDLKIVLMALLSKATYQ